MFQRLLARLNGPNKPAYLVTEKGIEPVKVLDFLTKLFPAALQIASVYVKNPQSQQIEAILIGEAATILADIQALHASRTQSN